MATFLRGASHAYEAFLLPGEMTNKKDSLHFFQYFFMTLCRPDGYKWKSQIGYRYNSWRHQIYVPAHEWLTPGSIENRLPFAGGGSFLEF